MQDNCSACKPGCKVVWERAWHCTTEAWEAPYIVSSECPADATGLATWHFDRCEDSKVIFQMTGWRGVDSCDGGGCPAVEYQQYYFGTLVGGLLGNGTEYLAYVEECCQQTPEECPCWPPPCGDLVAGYLVTATVEAVSVYDAAGDWLLPNGIDYDPTKVVDSVSGPVAFNYDQTAPVSPSCLWFGLGNATIPIDYRDCEGVLHEDVSNLVQYGPYTIELFPGGWTVQFGFGDHQQDTTKGGATPVGNYPNTIWSNYPHQFSELFCDPELGFNPYSFFVRFTNIVVTEIPA